MSKRSRRTVKVKQTISYEESPTSESENSDQDTNWLELFAMAFQDSSRRRRRRTGGHTSRKKSSPRGVQRTPRRVNTSKTVGRGQTITVNNTTTVPLLTPANNVTITTCVTLDDNTVDEQSQKVKDKVEQFFKAHNLISEDEDENEKQVKHPPKNTKEFYELSDSDDLNTPQPSTSNAANNALKKSGSSSHVLKQDDSPKCSTDELFDIIEIPPPSADEELMDVVDKILESTDKTPETAVKDQSWTDYKSKAEEILGNISSLLNEISKDAKPKSVEPEPQKEPEPMKPTCPICFEKLGGEVLAVATTCGHIFCKPCIDQVIKTAKKCPTCRKSINQKKTHPIYL